MCVVFTSTHTEHYTPSYSSHTHTHTHTGTHSWHVHTHWTHTLALPPRVSEWFDYISLSFNKFIFYLVIRSICTFSEQQTSHPNSLPLPRQLQSDSSGSWLSAAGFVVVQRLQENDHVISLIVLFCCFAVCRYACHRKCCSKMTTKCSKKVGGGSFFSSILWCFHVSGCFDTTLILKYNTCYGFHISLITNHISDWIFAYVFTLWLCCLNE